MNEFATRSYSTQALAPGKVYFLNAFSSVSLEQNSLTSTLIAYKYSITVITILVATNKTVVLIKRTAVIADPMIMLVVPSIKLATTTGISATSRKQNKGQETPASNCEANTPLPQVSRIN